MGLKPFIISFASLFGNQPYNECLMKEDLRYIIKGTGWAKFISIMMILGGIGGILGCITIPLGILQIIAAIKLWKTAEEMDRYKTSLDEGVLYGIFDNLSGFFIWYGWATLIGIILGLIILILYAVLIVMGVFGSLESI